jgi:hypothetical protein
MNGYCHELVALIALANLEPAHRQILSARWRGIEAGSTMSDYFRVMWDIVAPTGNEKHLIHRCFVDSDNPKDHGCAIHAYDYATGCSGFIEQYMAGELDDAYTTEESFLENLGMYLGIVSHHIADMCTPVHVGHKMDYRRAGSESARKFHSRFERQMGRLARQATVSLRKPARTPLTQDYFWEIAHSTYEDLFLPLEQIYADNDLEGLQEVTSEAISRSIRCTADVWHTVMADSEIRSRKWSQEPFI